MSDEALTIFDIELDGTEHDLTENELQLFKDEVNHIGDTSCAGLWRRRNTYDVVRWAYWENQSDDGRKHAVAGTQPFPFEGASDARIRVADMIINEQVKLMLGAARKSRISISGMEGTDEAFAQRMMTVLQYLIRNELKGSYRIELEKAAQFMLTDTPACAVMAINWLTETGLKRTPVTMDTLSSELVRIIPDATPENLEDFQMMIQNPLEAEKAAQALALMYPVMTESMAKQVVDDLREKGVGHFPEPYVKADGPRMSALRLFDDVFIHFNTPYDLQRARIIVRREWLSKAEVRERQVTHGYSKGFVEKMVGSGSEEQGYEGQTAFPTRWRDNDNSWVELYTSDNYKGLYEVLTGYFKSTDADGVTGIYISTFSTFIDQAARPVTLLDDAHGQYPFVFFSREAITNNIMDSRSVSEIVMTDQASIKLLHDGAQDSTQVSTLPPIFVPYNRPDVPLIIRPLAQIKRQKTTDYEFMKPPEYPRLNADQQTEIWKRINQYFGRATEDVPEELRELHQQGMIDSFLECVTLVLTMLLQVSQQKMPEERFRRIMGSDNAPIATEREEIAGSFDMFLDFDAKTLDKKYILLLAQAISKFIIPMDTSQTIQRDELVRWLIESVSPQVAERITIPVAAANQREVDEEEVNFAKIVAGIEPEMAEDGQNFELRKETLEGIIQKNPTALGNLNEVSREIFDKRRQHLHFMVTQQRNAMIGRVGAEGALEELADPDSLEELASGAPPEPGSMPAGQSGGVPAGV